VRSAEGKTAVLEIDDAAEFSLDQVVELSSETVVYLGVVRQTEKATDSVLVWLDLEHQLERSSLVEVQSSWGDSWGKITENNP
jgi:hypothetical protein